MERTEQNANRFGVVLIEGRLEMILQRSPRHRLLVRNPGWRKVARFLVSPEPIDASRGPVRVEEFKGLFPDASRDENGGVIGPRRFAAYV